MNVAPAWLIAAFTRAATHLGAQAPASSCDAAAQELAQAWMEPGRFFHNLEHLKALLENIDFMAQTARNPDALRLAAWFHGVRFDVSAQAVAQAKDGLDIHAGALKAQEVLTSLEMPQPQVQRVVGLIESLEGHRGDPDDIDAQVLSDADLSILAADPEDYLDYMCQLRREYSAYDDAEFVSARSQVVSALLARRQLFWTHAASAWEELARENLRAELERLQKPDTRSLPEISVPLEGGATDGDAAGTQSGAPGATDAVGVAARVEDGAGVGSVGAAGSVDAATPEVSVQTPGEDLENEDEAKPEEDRGIDLDADIEDPADTSTMLSSTLESVENLMDTMAMKAIKTPSSPLKPMSTQD